MTALVNRFDDKEDFFKVTPELLYIKEFAALKKSNKDYSSILWFVAYLCDEESKFSRYSKQARIEILTDTVLPKASVEKYSDLIKNLSDAYYTAIETPIKRMLRFWKEKLDEKNVFFLNTPYTQETWEMLDKMQSNFVAAYKQYEQIMKELSKDEGANMGGSQDSLSDSGVI